MLHELGVPTDHEAVQGGLELILDACRDDGFIRVAPRAPLYPCYAAEAARVLCRFGLADHPSVQRTMRYLLDSVHGTGSWRCNFTRFGRGPETRYANPGATLYALDTLRFGTEHRAGVVAIDHAVESLLDHWETREPLGPCHWGIGTQFLGSSTPSCGTTCSSTSTCCPSTRERGPTRGSRAAVSALEAKLDVAGRLVVERPHPRLRGLAFCARGEPSALATARHGEIRRNLTA